MYRNDCHFRISRSEGTGVKIVGTIPVKTVAVIDDAIRVPTVIDVMEYDDANVREHILGRARPEDGREMGVVAERANRIFGSSA